jgi:hypothetical protein
MKFLRVIALLAPIALAAPISAQAAMSGPVKDKFISDCVATAGQKLDEKSAKAHCECGADAVGKNFSDAEIKDMSSGTKPLTKEQTEKMQKSVAEHCVQPKK